MRSPPPSDDPHNQTEQRRRLRLALEAAGDEVLRRRGLVRIAASFVAALALVALSLWLLVYQ